ncbi:MAG: NAD-dependent epimerase/dehydratase family protein [Dehalococcoidia bacterium]|nr:NAD-dependent epimerase/dehydratase family protein [Dehalococcoidia bacterium]
MILVAGAAGRVGTGLMVHLLRQPERPLRVFVRREFDAVRLRDRGIEAAVGDLVDGRGVDAAMRGVRTLVYLVHALDRRGDFVANDLEAARNTTLAARAAGVERIIFLGHIAAEPEVSSRYLVGRWAVERALVQSDIPCTVLRAPTIVARGSAPFELATLLARRLPVVPEFRWWRTPIEPVALADVVEALARAIDDDELDGRSFDIAGPERMSVGAMVRGWASAAGRPRAYVPLPVDGLFVQRWASWALGGYRPRETRLLLETYLERQVCTDPSRRFPLPHRPLPLRQALAQDS